MGNTRTRKAAAKQTDLGAQVARLEGLMRDAEQRAEQERVAAQQRENALHEQLAALRISTQDAEAAAAAAAAQVAVAEAAAVAATNAAAPGGSGTRSVNHRSISKPSGRFSIFNAMSISVQQYTAIQRYLRYLVAASGLDLEQDFHRQDAVKLGLLYEAAATKYPVLSRYENNWASGSLVQQYLANRRKHLIKVGVLDARPRRHRLTLTELQRKEQAVKAAAASARVRRARKQLARNIENLDPALGGMDVDN